MKESSSYLYHICERTHTQIERIDKWLMIDIIYYYEIMAKVKQDQGGN